VYRITTLLALPLFFLSCEKSVIFDEEKMPGNPWFYQSVVAFEYEVEDTSIPYDVMLEVRHQDTFAFENLYVKAVTYFPAGDSTAYPLSLQLANSTGDWQGDCSGGVCKTTIHLSDGAYFRSRGKYSIRLEQFSRQAALPGIESLRLKVMKNENNK
jgi:gliding motility-associated lipoprotein GldH